MTFVVADARMSEEHIDRVEVGSADAFRQGCSRFRINAEDRSGFASCMFHSRMGAMVAAYDPLGGPRNSFPLDTKASVQRMLNFRRTFARFDARAWRECVNTRAQREGQRQ